MTMSRGEMPETNKVALVDWNRVTHVVIAGATRRAESSRDPTCLEAIIATALANAVALASAACSDPERELAGVDLKKVMSLVAERTVATVLDDAILLLREILKRCIERGDASVYALGEDEEGDEAVRLSLGNTRCDARRWCADRAAEHARRMARPPWGRGSPLIRPRTRPTGPHLPRRSPPAGQARHP